MFPRHTAVLGTTGGGKSNTVAGLVKRATDRGMAVVLLDVEGEYTRLHEPADDPRMLSLLRDRGLSPEGVPAGKMTVLHLVGRDSANPDHPRRREFSLQFAQLSPYAVFEILGLSDPQQERFLKAYDIAKEVLRDLDIFPKKGNAEQERLALEVDEFERGYPRLTLPVLLDVVGACLARAEHSGGGRKGAKKDDDAEELAVAPRSRELNTPGGAAALARRVHAANPPGNPISWRATLGRLGRLHRLRVFYEEGAGPKPMVYSDLLRPGHLSVIDLSDSGYSELNNLVIADILRGLQTAQDELCAAAEAGGPAAPRGLVVVEEAHEFLSDEKIDKMPVLFQQVARLARRGPEAVARALLRDAVAGPPAEAGARAVQQFHPPQADRPAGRCDAAANRRRGGRRLVGPAPRAGPGPGGGELPAHDAAADGEHRPGPREAPADGLRRMVVTSVRARSASDGRGTGEGRLSLALRARTAADNRDPVSLPRPRPGSAANSGSG